MSDVASDRWNSACLKIRYLGPDPQDEVERACLLVAEAACVEERRSADREVALARLGLSSDADRKTVFRRVESLATQHPVEAADFWYAAYAAIPPLVNASESALQQLSDCEARLRSLEDDVKDLAWPGSWDRRLCPIWKSYEGSGPGAASWAAAGWEPDLVMLAPVIPGFEEVPPFGLDGAPLKARLTATDVPLLTEDIRSYCSEAIAILEFDLCMEAFVAAGHLRMTAKKEA